MKEGAMRRVAALLRGVNVGGARKLPMADLRRVLEAIGYEDPQTLLASGNAVFGTKANAPAVERAVEAALEERLGMTTDVLVRDGDELAAVIAANPFADMARTDPARLVAFFTKGEPSAEKAKAIRIAGREAIAVGPGCLYVSYPDGQGTSKLTGATLERGMGLKGTARNWNTVSKLAAMTAARPN